MCAEVCVDSDPGPVTRLGSFPFLHFLTYRLVRIPLLSNGFSTNHRWGAVGAPCGPFAIFSGIGPSPLVPTTQERSDLGRARPVAQA